MTPFYLRFTDEAEALAMLKEAGLLGDDKPVYTKDLLRQWEVPDTDPEAEPGDMVTYQEFGEPYQIGTQRYQHPGLDLIGESYRNDAVIEDGKVVQPATKRDGYFVNWIGNELPAVLQPYATKPATPFRVFAGHSPEEIAAKEATSTLEHEGTPQ